MKILQQWLFGLVSICLASSWALAVDAGLSFVPMNGHQELESLPRKIAAQFLLKPGQEFLELIRRDVLDPDTQVMKIYIGALVKNRHCCCADGGQRVFEEDAGILDFTHYEILPIDHF